MSQKKHEPEEIVAKLRQVDVLVSQGRSVSEAVRAISVTPFTYYRWRKEFGGLKGDQVKRLKDLEKENERLRKAVSDLTLEQLILKGSDHWIERNGNFSAPRGVAAASTRSWPNFACPSVWRAGFTAMRLSASAAPPSAPRRNAAAR